MEHKFSINCKLQRITYLNNIQEQDHRFIKRMIKNNQWFQSFNTAKNTIAGYEAMHMIKKGQIRYIAGTILSHKSNLLKSCLALLLKIVMGIDKNLKY